MPDDVAWLRAALHHHTAFQVVFHAVAGEVGAADKSGAGVDDDQLCVHRSTRWALRSRPGEPGCRQVREYSAVADEAGVVLVPLDQQRDLHTTVAGAVHRFGDTGVRARRVAHQQDLSAGSIDEFGHHRRREPSGRHPGVRPGPHHVDAVPGAYRAHHLRRTHQQTGQELGSATRQDVHEVVAGRAKHRGSGIRAQCEQPRAAPGCGFAQDLEITGWQALG